jgi:hypothetical protein
MGGPNGLQLDEWENFQASGNTFWSKYSYVEISSCPISAKVPNTGNIPKPDLSHYTFTGNTYYLDPDAPAFIYSNDNKDWMANRLSFKEWQKLGLDRNSKALPVKDGKPTGTKVFVFGNKYADGRANVGIFNWDGLKEAEVDLSSVLKKGAKYVVYNVLDIHQTIGQEQPVLSGVFDGRKLKFPLRQDPACPDFNAFLVLPK